MMIEVLENLTLEQLGKRFDSLINGKHRIWKRADDDGGTTYMIGTVNKGGLTTAEFEADESGEVTQAGRPIGRTLTKKQMASAQDIGSADDTENEEEDDDNDDDEDEGDEDEDEGDEDEGEDEEEDDES